MKLSSLLASVMLSVFPDCQPSVPAAKQQQKYNAHRAMVEYTAARGIAIPSRYRNLTVRHFTAAGVCLWKIKERDSRRTLRLLDVLPVWTWKTDK